MCCPTDSLNDLGEGVEVSWLLGVRGESPMLGLGGVVKQLLLEGVRGLKAGEGDFAGGKDVGCFPDVTAREKA